MFSLVLTNLQLLAQITDDFSDGDFTSNPVWTPDNSTNWTVVNNQLRSNSSVASSTFYISTPSTTALNAQWEFIVNLQFNTSSLNFVDVYLTSDLAQVTNASNNGYFVRIGGTTDEISLYKLSTGLATILIDGTDGITGSSNNILRIRVRRDASNMWTLERDATGSTNYVLEGSKMDDSFTSSSYFGIRIMQSTSSFFNKHFFDDFYVGPIILDNTPPSITTVKTLSSTELEVEFDEKIDETTSQLNSNYSINNNIGNPVSAILQADAQTVHLTFSQKFPNGVQSQLTITNIEDLVGNAISSSDISFLYFEPVPSKIKDIILTEIMADPSPPQELPEVEFVEIFNRSLHPFNLEGWKFTDGTRTAILPKYILLPQQYLIIASTSSAASLGQYGKVLGVSNFPSLNNSSDALVLKDALNLVIDSVYYSDSWYKDSEKKDGGWSLEIIDVNNVCSDKENWIASESETGGTPGKQNSVYAQKPDLNGPKLISVYPVSVQSLRLKFDEKLEEIIPGKENVKLNPTVTVHAIQFADKTLTELDVTFTENLQRRKEYSVSVDNIRDCSGNLIQSSFNSASFALAENADSLDVLINEILFNPRPTGVDFVEIINASDKFINLQNWAIANFEDGQIINKKILTSENFLFKPGAYLVFTKDGNVLKGEYLQSREETFLQVTLPSLNDDKGSVALMDNHGNIIDYFFYHKNMHSVFIKNEEGVSLERIALRTPTNEITNWKSASSSVGYATPGYINSNSREIQPTYEEFITVDPEAFIPVVGQPDFTQINYNFEKGGYVANVKIYDANGHLIKQLANNEILGTHGFMRWDGDRDDGTKARVGYYMVWFEIFDDSGKLINVRKRVAIAARF